MDPPLWPAARALGPDLDVDDDESMLPPQAPQAHRSESKPRLSKDAQETLEAHFRQQQKPTTAQKKGFAADLNVPLEKINNWFQNRRAKVKQDMKKQQQHQEYYKALFGSHTQPPPMGGDSSYVHPSFYQAINAAPVHGLPMPPVAVDQFSPTRFAFPPPPVAPTAAPPADPHHMWPGMHAAAALAYPQDYPSDPIFQQFFGLQDPHASDAPMIDYSNLQAYRKSFHPGQEAWDQYSAPPSAGLDGYATSTSASLFTASSSGDDASARFSDSSSFHASARHPSINSVNPAGVGSSRHPSGAWPHHMRMSSQHDSDAASFSQALHSPAFPTGPLQVAPNRSTAHVSATEPAPNFDAIHPAGHAPDTLLPTHLEESSTEGEQSERSASQPVLSAAVSVATNSASPEGSEMRSTHGASSSDDAEISPTSTIMKAPSSTTSSLAARRQRRPAALGINVLRSSSHGAAVPPSPGSAGLRAQADPNLRRIKSSTGVLTGRVQKSGFSSAQRSPMHFPDAAQSPNNLQRHISASSAAAPDGSEEARAAPPDPLTPMSPPASARVPSSLPSATIPVTEGGNEMLENIWNFMPNTATSTVFSWQPGYGEPNLSYSSPPATPMDAQHLAEMRLRNPSMPPFVAVPNSAPPWQTSFAKTDADLTPTGPVAPHGQMSAPQGSHMAMSMASGASFPHSTAPPQPFSVPMIQPPSGAPSGHSNQPQGPTHAQGPLQAPLQGPLQGPMQGPMQGPIQGPIQGSMQASMQGSMQASFPPNANVGGMQTSMSLGPAMGMGPPMSRIVTNVAHSQPQQQQQQQQQHQQHQQHQQQHHHHPGQQQRRHSNDAGSTPTHSTANAAAEHVHFDNSFAGNYPHP